jgi:uncharacterized protein DUF1549/uncharacterized protein DUF1553
MHGLRERLVGRSAYLRCLLLLAALICAGVGRAAPPGHAFNKGEWPFRPLERPAVPVADDGRWAINPIDQFILAELKKKGLEPNKPADKVALLRRVTFDLIGLPPTANETEAFLADHSPLAYERVVDRLLASPRFGERWARHWLDVVRYADTSGLRPDFHRVDAYRYRDYVISAFNEDLPYDRFVRQQLAGDELEPGNPQALIATGFLRLYPQEGFAADFVKQRQDVLDDVTEVTGLTFLGLTLGCAKCHDHKFDPIEQTDFFRLQACFSAILPRDDAPPVTPDVLAAYQRQQAIWEQATAHIRSQIDGYLVDPIKDFCYDYITTAYDGETREAWLTSEKQRTTRQQQLCHLSSRYMSGAINKRIRNLEGEEKTWYDALQAELAKFDHLKPQPLPTAMAVGEGPGPAPETHVLDAGDYRKPEETVSPGFPEFLGADEIDRQGSADPSVGGRRSALARWLSWPDHPLTARVIVNRLWQHHFGVGIVATSSDFGTMGDDASHPQLLDWLACELTEREWSLKAIHRMMVLSATYRQSSLIDASSPAHQLAAKADPTNKLLWHARRHRLEGEIVRDSLYALSGRIDTTMFGPNVYLRLPRAVMNSSRYAWPADSVEANLHRRSIYSHQMRNMRHPLLAAFDQPDLYISSGVRMNTLTPTQSLFLFNGEEATEQASCWAGRLLTDTQGDEQFIRRAWLEAYSRAPTDDELSTARQFLASQADQIYTAESDIPTSSQPQPCPNCLEPHKAAAYVDLCHALLNSTEFLFID